MKTLAQQLHRSNKQQQLFRLMLIGIVMSFVLYGFAIASTTISIADADMNNNEINQLQTEIAELEIKYFEMINDLSIQEAELYGLNEVPEVHYAHINETKSIAYNL